MLSNRLGKLVHAIGQGSERALVTVCGEEPLPDVLQEGERDAAIEGFVGHTHIGEAVLADVME